MKEGERQRSTREHEGVQGSREGARVSKGKHEESTGTQHKRRSTEKSELTIRYSIIAAHVIYNNIRKHCCLIRFSAV